jgi:hypothetical protein
MALFRLARRGISYQHQILTPGRQPPRLPHLGNNVEDQQAAGLRLVMKGACSCLALGAWGSTEGEKKKRQKHFNNAVFLIIERFQEF